MSVDCIQVLRSGSWIYDGEAVGKVRILKMKGDGPNLPAFEDDDDEVGNPPTDSEGYYYVAEFSLAGLGASNNGSSSWHVTAEEAVRYAEENLPSTISWEATP